ncbi:hypothetical protein [Butyrivibrio sp. YAB3001]|uniref:hypothetical protein n=1 Tax=Butyrivibrio sp. YAB3001 TaxID=1520812 RepID=UPI001131CA8D|nr:hypothetical protein [Butyrivibrio sp. YAB3001]
MTDGQYNKLVGCMNKKERREFERRQEELRRDREEDSPLFLTTLYLPDGTKESPQCHLDKKCRKC